MEPNKKIKLPNNGKQLYKLLRKNPEFENQLKPKHWLKIIRYLAQRNQSQSKVKPSEHQVLIQKILAGEKPQVTPEQKKRLDTIFKRYVGKSYGELSKHDLEFLKKKLENPVPTYKLKRTVNKLQKKVDQIQQLVNPNQTSASKEKPTAQKLLSELVNTKPQQSTTVQKTVKPKHLGKGLAYTGLGVAGLLGTLALANKLKKKKSDSEH
ncbi:MAG: hypothetical protein P3W91_007990 [Fervidobacterium sp.]|nr:hypothetical protein [Fervidobacterium sp.]